MGTRILVIDDEPDMLDLLTYVLSQGGWMVHTAQSGEEGIGRARRWRPDLIILDVMLPGLNGFDVCERLRRIPATQGIPVLMVTAMSGEMVRYHGMSCGATEFIRKPFSPGELRQRIRRILTAPCRDLSPKCNAPDTRNSPSDGEVTSGN